MLSMNSRYVSVVDDVRLVEEWCTLEVMPIASGKLTSGYHGVGLRKKLHPCFTLSSPYSGEAAGHNLLSSSTHDFTTRDICILITIVLLQPITRVKYSSLTVLQAQVLLCTCDSSSIMLTLLLRYPKEANTSVLSHHLLFSFFSKC